MLLAPAGAAPEDVEGLGADDDCAAEGATVRVVEFNVVGRALGAVLVLVLVMEERVTVGGMVLEVERGRDEVDGRIVIGDVRGIVVLVGGTTTFTVVFTGTVVVVFTGGTTRVAVLAVVTGPGTFEGTTGGGTTAAARGR